MQLLRFFIPSLLRTDFINISLDQRFDLLAANR